MNWVLAPYVFLDFYNVFSVPQQQQRELYGFREVILSFLLKLFGLKAKHN